MYSDFERILSERGLKVIDVRKATGVSSSTFTDWKAGRYTPKFDKMKKIADFLGVSVSVLSGDGSSKEAERQVMESDINHHIAALRAQLDTYYADSDAVEVAQAMKGNAEMRLLFDAAKDASPEDLKTVRDMLLLLKQRGKNAD